MSTVLQAATLQKAPTTTGTTTGLTTASHGAKALNGIHAHTSSSHASHVKASESIAGTVVHNSSSSASLSTSIEVKEKSYNSISIDISEEQKRIFHEGVCSFGDVLSQVPWMKFRLIAEPNVDTFASDIRLRTFIRQVTELTVSIVTKQCTEEIAILVAALITSLTSSMEVRIKLIVETIIKQIAELCLEDTMTACQNLNEIKEKICFPGRHCGPNGCSTGCDSDKHHHHTHDTYSDAHKHPHGTYGDSDKHKYPHDTYGDSDKHKHSHDSYSDHSDKSKRPNSYSESEKHKPGDHKPETPIKKPSGKLTPLPGAKSAF